MIVKKNELRLNSFMITPSHLADVKLQCPACHSQLTDTVCQHCGELFSQTMGILDLRWPRPTTSDPHEDQLIVRLLDEFATASFVDLTALWLRETAVEHAIPQNIVSFVEAYHTDLQQRGKQMVEMFNKQRAQLYSLPNQQLALDIGCGVGASSVALASQFNVVIGLDPSLPSLLMACKFLAEQNIDNVLLIQSYAQHIPLPNDAVDYAVGQNVIEHLFDVEPAFHELQRILKPNGCFCGDSRNRFDLFLPEPHAQLRWVGLWPRRLQARYVWRWRRMPYASTHLLSLWELKRFAHRAFGNSTQVVFPLSSAYGRSAKWDKFIQTIARIPILSSLLLSIFPSHLLIAKAT
jgi:ubiquinone/menaquinone biosynthesis C-methylase UbiE